MTFPKGNGDKYHGPYTCARCGEIVATYHNLHTQWRGKQYNHGTHYHKWCWELVKVGRAVNLQWHEDFEFEVIVATIGHLLIGDAPPEDK